MAYDKVLLRSVSLARLAELPDPAILYDHIIESRWSGLPNWECPACMYADLDRDRTLDHIRKFHVIPALEMKTAQQPQPSPGSPTAAQNSQEQ